MTENEQLEMVGIINRQKANETHYRRKVQNQRGIINGLQKKVSRLQAENEAYKHYYNECLKDLENAHAENKRLSTLAELGNMRANDYRVMRDRALKAEAEIERLKNNVSAMAITLSNSARATRHEAYKEYHEMVKQKLLDKGFYPAIVKSVLDEAEKEMVGESNDKKCI